MDKGSQEIDSVDKILLFLTGLPCTVDMSFT